MSWIYIDEDAVLTRLAGTELDAYRTKALAAGQADPLPEIIDGAVQEARSRIAACAKNELGDAGTIPDGLLHHLLAIIRYRLLTRIPINIREERRTEYQDALAFFREVADCQVAIEHPDSGEASQSPRPLITPKTRKFTSTDQEGT